MMLLRIEDKNGTILEEFMPETKEVLSESIAYTTINLMEGVTRYGSGVRLRTSGQNILIILLPESKSQCAWEQERSAKKKKIR